jgi:hypothetical protein
MITPRSLFVVISHECWRLQQVHHVYPGEILALTVDEASDHGDMIVPLRLSADSLVDLLDAETLRELARLIDKYRAPPAEPAPLPAIATPRARRAARAV